jgi:hypothetical protein
MGRIPLPGGSGIRQNIAPNKSALREVRARALLHSGAVASPSRPITGHSSVLPYRPAILNRVAAPASVSSPASIANGWGS